MKKQKIFFIIIIITFLIMNIIIINCNTNLKRQTKVIQQMSENEQITDLQTQINQLNVSHIEYAKNVQEYKKQIAEAITEMGVETSEDANAETMASNIRSISVDLKTTKISNSEYSLSNINCGYKQYLLEASYSDPVKESWDNYAVINSSTNCSYELIIRNGYSSTGNYTFGYSVYLITIEDLSQPASISFTKKDRYALLGIED